MKTRFATFVTLLTIVLIGLFTGTANASPPITDQHAYVVVSDASCSSSFAIQVEEGINYQYSWDVNIPTANFTSPITIEVEKEVDLPLIWYSSTDPVKKYAFGDRCGVTLTSALTISIIPETTLTVFTLAADTNITINATTSKAVIGDVLLFKIKANTSNRTMVFGTNLDGPNDTITATKTVTYQFIYTGSGYSLVAKAATD